MTTETLTKPFSVAINELSHRDEHDDCIYVDTKTAEILDSPLPSDDESMKSRLEDGSVIRLYREEIEPPTVPVQKARDEGDTIPWLSWYAEKKMRLEALKKALREQYQKRLKRVQFLLDDHHRHEDEAKVVVEDMIESKRGKGRYIDLDACRVGFRTTPPKTSIVDLEEAVIWCGEHLPSAIKVETSIRKSELPKGQVIPGIEITREDRLYIK